MGDAIFTRRFGKPAKTVITEGLKLYFDPANSQSYPGSGTTIFDLSTSGWNGTFGSGVSQSSDFGGTLLFPTNGTGYVNLGQQALYQPNNSPFTVQAFVRFTAKVGSRQMLVSRNVSLQGGPPYAWMFGPKDNDQMATYNGSAWVETGWTFVTNQWLNLAVVFNGSQVQHYVNGTEVGPLLNFSYSDSTSYNANLGGYTADTGMSGYMGPFLYYNRALTKNELQENIAVFADRY